MASTNKPTLDDDAPTPPAGTPVARIRRLTSSITRMLPPKWRNWRGIWIVVGFCVIFAAALIGFLLLSGNPAEV